MNIEDEVFKRSSIIFNRLEKYGFIKNNNNYVLEKQFLNDEFKAIITIDSNGKVDGKVIDLEVNEEYLGLRTEMMGEFASKVREAYKSILIDIKNKCCVDNYFIKDQSNRINNYIKSKYNDSPEFLWKKFPGYAVYRNKRNNKWYGIIMNLDLSKLDNGNGEVEIMNVKLNENRVQDLLKKNGFYKAYHMNKADWISVILNDTIKDEIIMELLDESYNLISEQK